MNRTASRFASSLLSLVAVGLLLAPVACGGDEEDTKDPAASCKSLCTDSGFSSSRVDVQPNEVNCFCSAGGASTVSAGACSKMCADIGRSGAQPFSGSGGPLDACQCD